MTFQFSFIHDTVPFIHRTLMAQVAKSLLMTKKRKVFIHPLFWCKQSLSLTYDTYLFEAQENWKVYCTSMLLGSKPCKFSWFPFFFHHMEVSRCPSTTLCDSYLWAEGSKAMFKNAKYFESWNLPWILQVNKEVEKNSLQLPSLNTHHKFQSRFPFYHHPASHSKLQIVIWFMKEKRKMKLTW